MSLKHYIIRGGIEGWERLRILSRVMQPTTLELLRRVGTRPGMTCLEVGCGSGDVAFDLARMVGRAGRVVATDIDQIKLDLARDEATKQQVENVEFRYSDIMREEVEGKFDLVHCRFILTHLPDPVSALSHMYGALRTDGIIAVEDIDFRGYFSYPDFEAHRQYVDLYMRTVERRGGDPCIGPKLPSLLADAGFQQIRMNVVQPAGTDGEVKLISPLTMENIADAVIDEGLLSREEADSIIDQLYTFARTEGTVGCMPRVIEAWGMRAAFA
ncbi:class I SAM-dependent methyltransferase [Edaphobacter aggregans]|uniref:class I SAM-dependent methyltransferase n=1 Tax=Edaphobacter aggregans TaxID=570835 RepID=UPI000A06A99A|nr:methyltransferase domain-containing protein [Edaphobacter aggregans]